ncbi:Peptidyl-tRNA hydrolase ICT1, mitochondrial [Chionoecetes opilio]|uniref:Large ribosomal subunit protein mL62 n=1 Tax=Chionoecetes opilio TaxID=41210 RepID=A0A8J5CDI9_CHIOP|nr:Peptidyl-tRNA hydrolase ICT1, mitochondrial [Chionoecetes opilio]
MTKELQKEYFTTPYSSTSASPPPTPGLLAACTKPYLINIYKVQVTYSRSSGPGGQNVNKINSKVDLRFHLASAEWLTSQLKEKVVVKYSLNPTEQDEPHCRRVPGDSSDKTRSQQLNLAEAMDKLRHLIHTAAYVPPPPSVENVERARRRHEAATRERLRQKKSRSVTKQGRQAPDLC